MDGGATKMSMDKGKAIESALLQIEKKFGKGAIMRLGERPHEEIGAISTNCLSLDAAIGVGGFPRGRIVEVYGPESSGKTTLALTVVASAQKTGGICAYIDAEHAMDPEYATKLGVNIDDMLISQPDSGEQALEIAETLIRSNSVDVIVIDSVAALVPRAELDGEMGDSLPGLQARLMSQALRKITAIVSSSNTCFIFINQLREKIGVFFGSPETTTGGKALKFYASLRLDIRRIGAIKDGDKVVGNRTRVKVVKNKCAAVSRVGIRHHVRRRHLTRGRSARSGRQITTSSKRAVRGFRTRANVSARAATTSRICSRKTPICSNASRRTSRPSSVSRMFRKNCRCSR